MSETQGFVVNGNGLALGPVEDAEYIEVPNAVADEAVSDWLGGEEDGIAEDATRTVSIKAMLRIFDRAYTLCIVGGNRGTLDGDEFDVALFRLNADMVEAINTGSQGPQE